MTDIVDNFDRQTIFIIDMWAATFESLGKVTYEGLTYIGHETNKALTALGGEALHFNLTKPKPTDTGTSSGSPQPQAAGAATGGMIGLPGERGRDQVRTILGRGEAVLNYAQQQYVEPALHHFYGHGLQDTFRRVRGYHAGGPGMGFAGGGYTGPGHSGEGFTPVWNMAKNKFKMTNFTGFDGHSYLTSSGNVSDHSKHAAIDMSNGVLTPQEDALSNFFKTKVPQVVKQLIWRNKDQFRGFPVSGHEDHVHLAMLDRFAFNSALMAKVLSRAMRGLSIADLMTGDGSTVSHVGMPDVDGKDPLRNMIQRALRKVLGAANSAIDKIAARLQPGADTGGHHGEPYDGPLNKLFPAHSLANAAGHTRFSPEQVKELAESVGLPGRVFEQIAHGESQYYPGIVSNDGGYGLWQNTPRVWGASALAYLASLGGTGQLLNPYKNALMAKFLYDSAGKTISPWFGTDYVTGAATGGHVGGVPEFATGGPVPGGEGQPIPIIAHAGEWVLNRAQQSKVAGMLGTSIGKLRDFMGFTGGPTSFQGGGEPFSSTGTPPPSPLEASRYRPQGTRV